MSKPYIRLITSTSGNWQILDVDYGEDFRAEGHSIGNFNWIGLLNYLGYEVDVMQVSDIEMKVL